MKKNRIRVLAGGRIALEGAPYDLTKGRITVRQDGASSGAPTRGAHRSR
jgi:translation initiation factor IF-1